jgi:hypothetical protein
MPASLTKLLLNNRITILQFTLIKKGCDESHPFLFINRLGIYVYLIKITVPFLLIGLFS